MPYNHNTIKKLLPKTHKFTSIYENRVFYADMETILINDVHQPIAFGYCNINGTISDVFVVNPKSSQIKEDFLIILSKCLGSLKKDNYIIYFHNLSGFDGFLLLKNLYNLFPADEVTFIEKDNKIYEIRCKNLLLKDSYLLLPKSLKKLSQITNIYYTKSNFKYENISSIWFKKPFLIKVLLKNDILCLLETFTLFARTFSRNFNINIYDFLSLSSLSLNLYLDNFYEKPLIVKNNIYIDRFIRKSYLGGAAELFKPYLKNGYHYDANSLYPSMMVLDMPLSICNFSKDIKRNNILNFFGFLDVTIITPRKISNPFLSKNVVPNGIIFPRGDWRGVYFSEELKVAVSLGYKVRIHKRFGFKRGKILKNFILLLYRIKRINSNNNLFKNLAKLMMNSLYGRFGMKTTKDFKKIIKFEDFERFKFNKVITSFKSLDLNNLFVYYRRLLDDNKSALREPNTAVQIASCITGYGRIFIYRYKNIPNNFCYYSDTDSVFLAKRLPKYLVNDLLGKFKLVTKLKFAYFISVKRYILVSNQNNIVFKLKGVKSTEYKNLTTQFFYDKLSQPIGVKDSPSIIERINYFSKDLKNFSIMKKKSIFKIKLQFKHRKRIYAYLKN